MMRYFCADGHPSYKGFAIDHELTLVVLRANLKQYIKNGIYHIQNVNSLHNRIKKWINSTFWGVSTKYLQNYLNWYKVKQKIKNYSSPLEGASKGLSGRYSCFGDIQKNRAQIQNVKSNAHLNYSLQNLKIPVVLGHSQLSEFFALSALSALSIMSE